MWWTITICLLLVSGSQSNDRPVWTWKCQNSRCEKNLVADGEKPQSLPVCSQICNEYANLWPQPTGDMYVSNERIAIDPDSVSVAYNGESAPTDEVKNMIQVSGQRFQRLVAKKAEYSASQTGTRRSLVVKLNIEDPTQSFIILSTDESYELNVSTESNNNLVVATISAITYFGARHGLETLSQLIICDDYLDTMVIPVEVRVIDKPIYPYRGILLDTSRSFYSIDSIKRTLEAMAANKLNTFHWHMTDSHSFPYHSKKYPRFTCFGAYSPEKIYTCEQIRNLSEYACALGIRVMPEIDQPAHVGEGWQWAPNTTVCFKAEPWQNFCSEPPCGQLDPTNKEVLEILRDLYGELFECFKPVMVHMGGDEVNFNCWNSSERITEWMSANGLAHTESGFLSLWKRFQDNSYAKLIEANGGEELPAFLWSSSLTDAELIEKDKYIIQIWSKGDDPVVSSHLEYGFPIIMSNYDALYLDCGFGSWTGTGNNWCSPYKGWQKLYDNDPRDLAGNVLSEEMIIKLVLGAEATLFSEQADDTSVDSRIWPRACAMAERLWSRPKGNWTDAEQRILAQRERLVKSGVNADRLEPEWCQQNPGKCSQ